MHMNIACECLCCVDIACVLRVLRVYCVRAARVLRTCCVRAACVPAWVCVMLRVCFDNGHSCSLCFVMV